MTMLKVENLSVHYGMIQAVRDVSFEVNEGEVVSLIGANGAGKTTILRTISGLVRPSAGKIEFLGNEMKKVFSRFPRLEERKNQDAATLSGGEQQMLAMGRALMSTPKLLLLDEPSMGLAPIFIQEIFDIIQDIQKQGTTVLLIEQNANKALSIANRGYVLETGKIVLSGTGQELLASDEVRKAYLGG